MLVIACEVCVLQHSGVMLRASSQCEMYTCYMYLYQRIADYFLILCYTRAGTVVHVHEN